MENKKLRIVVACGGTGGHVFPGLATAQELRERGHEVEIWMSGRAIESATLTGWEGAVFRTGAKQLSLRNMPAVTGAVWRSYRRLKSWRADRLLAMGSYASLPPALAAHWCRIPLVLHEANAVPGKAVEQLARFAKTVAVSFPGTAAMLKHHHTVLTGMPVRASLAGAPPLDGFSDADFTVLVTGGSQGAHRVNKLACEACCDLQQCGMQGLRVIHQCGKDDVNWIRERYAAASVNALVVPFLQEMGRAYASAKLVIARAGAATCAELALCGVPAIFIPLPTAIRDHQRLNAEMVANDGASIIMLEKDINAGILAQQIRVLRDKPEQLAQMGKKMLAKATPDAAVRLADLVEKPFA